MRPIQRDHCPVVPESGDIHHGVVRIHDPDGNPISLSESFFGAPDERKVPGIRHIAYNAMDPEGMREFYSARYSVSKKS